MQKKRGLILFIFSLIIIGLMYSKRKPEAPMVGAKKITVFSTSVEAIRKDHLESPKVMNEKRKELPEETLDQVLVKYSQNELELLSSASKAGVNLKIVKEYIESSRLIKDREKLIALAKEISQNDLSLKIELIQWVKNKYPQNEPPVNKVKKPLKSSSIFKNIQKVDG